MKTYKIYTDGGCQVNPGGKGAYGCVILTPKGEEVRLSQGFLASTNNRMEIMGPIAALRWFTEPSIIELYSDSQYVINTMNGQYAKKKNKDLWEILEKETKKHISIKWIWVRGHNGNKYNEMCDELATKAMEDIDLIDDTGYAGEKNVSKRTGLPKENSMATKINILTENYVFSDESVKEEAKRRGCNENCIKAIRQFYQIPKHSFKDYVNLKTFGNDSLSSIKSDCAFQELIGQNIFEKLKENLAEDKEVKTAARWIARGLTTYDAIRKVLVDKEIHLNAVEARLNINTYNVHG